MGKRKYIQLLSALLYNANLPGFARGKIYQGMFKGVCVPGLNCYSCPGAVAACPLGALQAALGEVTYKLPLYTVGMLLLFGVLLGRGVCAFLCPFGLLQELLYKIPSPKIPRSKITWRFSWLKYLVLALLVIILPLFYLFTQGAAVPAFCKFLCPAGTLEGAMILVLGNTNMRSLAGVLFAWKFFVLIIVVMACVLLYRAFCRFLCPLGAIYSLFNRYALLGLHVNRNKCTGCGACVRMCKMDTRQVNDRECLRCGECRSACKHRALNYSFKEDGKCHIRQKLS